MVHRPLLDQYSVSSTSSDSLFFPFLPFELTVTSVGSTGYFNDCAWDFFVHSPLSSSEPPFGCLWSLLRCDSHYFFLLTRRGDMGTTHNATEVFDQSQWNSKPQWLLPQWAEPLVSHISFLSFRIRWHVPDRCNHSLRNHVLYKEKAFQDPFQTAYRQFLLWRSAFQPIIARTFIVPWRKRYRRFCYNFQTRTQAEAMVRHQDIHAEYFTL